MRVLFTSWAWPSHLYAMVPLGWACRAAGHEVRFASQPGLASAITNTGLSAVAVGHDVDAISLVRDLVPHAGRRRYSRQPTGGQAIPPLKGPRVLGMFLRIAEAMADELVAFARAWRPDLVVYDPTAWAAPLAAAAVGVPAVQHLFGVDLLYGARDLVKDLLAGLADRVGADDVDPLGSPTVDPCPIGLQVPAGYHRIPVRYVPYNGPGTAPAWLLNPPRRPRVCVTWGTTLARLDPSFFLARPVVAAIRELNVEVVAAVSADQRGLLGSVPYDVRVAESVPLHLLLPTCDLVVAHGGAGTMLTALASGLPQLLVPQLPDHAAHARRLADTGAAEVLQREAATAEAIRSVAARLLHTSAPRTAAERHRQDMEQQPPPAAVVAALEQLATVRGPAAPTLPIKTAAPGAVGLSQVPPGVEQTRAVSPPCAASQDGSISSVT
jgi:Protein of unknown function (DUF1205)